MSLDEKKTEAWGALLGPKVPLWVDRWPGGGVAKRPPNCLSVKTGNGVDAGRRRAYTRGRKVYTRWGAVEYSR